MVALILLLLLAQRPTTCTPGVGYWDVNAKVLYTCGPAPNTWKIAYVPKGSDVPPIPNPIPPDPDNKPPTITMTFDPVIPVNGIIMVKNQRIVLKMADDTGVVWTELLISRQGVVQKVWEGDEASQKTYTWNTAPFRGKGDVQIMARTRDAEGLTATSTRTVSVKK